MYRSHISRLINTLSMKGRKYSMNDLKKRALPQGLRAFLGLSCLTGTLLLSSLMAVPASAHQRPGGLDHTRQGAQTRIAEEEPSFAPAVHYALPAESNSVDKLLTADLEGNGSADLVVFGRTEFNTLRNKGDGTFETAVTHTFEKGRMVDMTAKDLDGDGRADIITVNQNDSMNNVFIQYGDGKGGFSATNTYSLSLTPNKVQAGDLSGDGHPDIVVVGSSGQEGNKVAVLENMGNRNYRTGYIKTLSGGFIESFKLADLNKDGRLDLVLGINQNIVVLMNKGDGTFGDPVSYSLPATAGNMAIADLDGDGAPEIIALDRRNDGAVSILHNKGDGTFEAPKQVRLAKEYLTDIAAGDFNGDGHADLAGTDSSNDTTTVMHNKGDGTFGTPKAFSVGKEPDYIVSADFNKDGRDDIATGYDGAGNVSVLISQKASTGS